MTRTATANHATARNYLAARKPFKCTNWHAEVDVAATAPVGRLPQEWVPLFRLADKAYVVYSWATPIAWVDVDGTVVVPDARYSVSTSKHQGQARAWLAR